MKEIEYNLDLSRFNYKKIKTLNGYAYYLNDGQYIHHDYLPSLVTIGDNGVRSYLWFDQGIMYRKGRQAFIRTEFINEKHLIVSINFHELKELNKGEKALTINCLQNLISTSSIWPLPFNSQRHSLNNPSFYYQDGRFGSSKPAQNVYFEEWYKKDQLHRENGPATIIYDKFYKKKLKEIWYIEGEEIS